jgi:hypothetical protein
LTQSNGPLSTNQIVNRFVNHFANQNDKAQIDCLIMLNMSKTTCLDWQGGFFNAYHFWVFFD